MRRRRSDRLITVYGTVMGRWNDGRWFVHRVESTSPDGRRITLDVASKKPFKGSVTVRWDPRGIVEPRFAPGFGWLLYVAIGVVVVAAGVVVILFVL